MSIDINTQPLCIMVGSQEHFSALATSPACFRVSLTNLAFLVARFRPTEIQMPSMYIIIRRPLSLQYRSESKRQYRETKVFRHSVFSPRES